MTVTRKQAAEILGVSYNGVRKMEARGELEGSPEVRNGVAFVVFAIGAVERLAETRRKR
jgi:hypothetical protein